MLIPVPLKISEYARPRSLNHSPEAFLGYLNAKVRDVHLPWIFHMEGEYRKSTMKGLSLQKSSIFTITDSVYIQEFWKSFWWHLIINLSGMCGSLSHTYFITILLRNLSLF